MQGKHFPTLKKHRRIVMKCIPPKSLQRTVFPVIPQAVPFRKHLPAFFIGAQDDLKAVLIRILLSPYILKTDAGDLRDQQVDM